MNNKININAKFDCVLPSKVIERMDGNCTLVFIEILRIYHTKKLADYQHNYVEIKMDYLMKRTGFSRNKLRAIIQALYANGIIDVLTQNNPKESNLYCLNFDIINEIQSKPFAKNQTIMTPNYNDKNFKITYNNPRGHSINSCGHNDEGDYTSTSYIYNILYNNIYNNNINNTKGLKTSGINKKEEIKKEIIKEKKEEKNDLDVFYDVTGYNDTALAQPNSGYTVKNYDGLKPKLRMDYFTGYPVKGIKLSADEINNYLTAKLYKLRGVTSVTDYLLYKSVIDKTESIIIDSLQFCTDEEANEIKTILSKKKQKKIRIIERIYKLFKIKYSSLPYMGSYFNVMYRKLNIKYLSTADYNSRWNELNDKQKKILKGLKQPYMFHGRIYNNDSWFDDVTLNKLYDLYLQDTWEH